MVAFAENTIFTDGCGYTFYGKHRKYEIPMSDLYSITTMVAQEQPKDGSIDIALSVKPKVEELREHAKILNDIADALEAIEKKKDGEKDA